MSAIIVYYAAPDKKPLRLQYGLASLYRCALGHYMGYRRIIIIITIGKYHSDVHNLIGILSTYEGMQLMYSRSYVVAKQKTNYF